MPSLRIAQAQINPTVGDLYGNLELIRSHMDQAQALGADIVTFPELTISGYPPEDLLFKPRFLENCCQALGELTADCHGITAIVGYPELREGLVYNSAAVLGQGRVLGSYRKTELPNYGVFDEVRYFSPGQGCMLLELGGARVILSICEDLWVRRSMVEMGALEHQAQVTLNISGSPFHAGKLRQRQEILSRFARRTSTVVCYNNLLGGQDELVFDGGSLVMSPTGEVLASARRFAPDMLVTDLDLPAAASIPAPKFPDRLVTLQPFSGPRPASRPPVLDPEIGELEEVYQALVLGTRDYMRKNGFGKVVLGLSGGIDSSLVAAIAVEALGVDNVIGVTMPSQYTSAGTRSDAEILAANLGIRFITLPIEGILEVYLRDMAPALGQGPYGVEVENLQARIRGNLLMTLSNRFGWLVLTTGNKSETAVGYCTLYGDMAGGFAVIKDVPKTLVYQVSTQVNVRAGREIIPESVFARPPSAELRPDQKDSDSLPPYEILDPILKAYVEEDLALDDIVGKGFELQMVRQVLRLVDLNEYKRRQAPPGVKITPKAFGRDRRLPITNLYRPGA
jgi:NAD+ synthase (glutamine-hydrolysing)